MCTAKAEFMKAQFVEVSIGIILRVFRLEVSVGIFLNHGEGGMGVSLKK
jgi:hypothetical protein